MTPLEETGMSGWRYVYFADDGTVTISPHADVPMVHMARHDFDALTRPSDPRITQLESALRAALELLAAAYDESSVTYSAVLKVANRALEGKSE